MKKPLWLLALALACGLIAAGCGGDDDDGGDSGGSEALSKEDYLAAGNANCKAGDAELDPAGQEAGQSQDPATQEAFVTDTFVPNVQGQIDFLRDGIPEGDEDQVNGILDDAEAALDSIDADPSILFGGSEDPFSGVGTALAEYGLTECAN